jgi:flagellar basal body-associated protein FliL
MADETPKKKSPVLWIVLLAVAVLVVLPGCLICGLTVLGGNLSNTFDYVSSEIAPEPMP